MSTDNKKTNPLLISLIKDLKKKSHENDVQIWKDLASRLEKSSKRYAEINLDKINNHLQNNETALIPGKVLSSGELTKKTSVAALSFSEKAKNKIKKSGGKCITIEELVKENPKGKNVRILC